jgi:hypothetical protein
MGKCRNIQLVLFSGREFPQRDFIEQWNVDKPKTSVPVRLLGLLGVP